jgi:RimJ/RimL family protein N-acetyltransferase
MIFPPNFTTKRLFLKAVAETDIPSYEKYFLDYEVIRHLASTVPWPYPENGVRDFVKENIIPKQGKDKWVWGIFLQQCPEELIGVVDLWRPGKPENRGFWLGKKFWGQGIMTEAVIPINDFAFTSLEFEKLTFSNAKGNIKSRRIKEKTGAKFLRIEPALFVDPIYKEHEIWELTKKDWIENKKS